MIKSKKNHNFDKQIWAIRLCAIAAVSSLVLATLAHDKKITKAVAASTSAVFWGLGSGMAFTNLLNRKNERN